jgi:hypothetical protein
MTPLSIHAVPVETGAKACFARTVDRHIQLQKAFRGCLIQTHLPAEQQAIRETPLPPLEELDFANDPLQMPRILCDRAERLAALRRDYSDDGLTYLSPRYGTGILGAMLFGKITFGSNTSWFEPSKNDLADLSGFTWSLENIWTDRVIQALIYMADRLNGICHVFLEGYHAPLEFASMLRGSQIYLDLITHPSQVHRLLQRCDQAMRCVINLIAKEVPPSLPGVLARLLWMEKGLPFLSDDSNVLISAEHYAEFGRKYAGALFADYGGGYLHQHTSAYHQQDNLSAMQGLTLYHWRIDPQTPEPAEVLETLLPGAQKKIVVLDLSPAQVKEHIDRLALGRFFLRVDCTDVAEQHQMVELVRTRAPLIMEGQEKSDELA